jgi:hypothetical protein
VRHFCFAGDTNCDQPLANVSRCVFGPFLGCTKRCTKACTKRCAREAHPQRDAIGSSHRSQMAVTSRYDLKAPGRGLGGGTPASEVSTTVTEAHAIYDAQPRRRDFMFGITVCEIQQFWDGRFFIGPATARRRRLSFALRQTTTARSDVFSWHRICRGARAAYSFSLTETP